MNIIQQRKAERRIDYMLKDGLASFGATISPAPPAKDRYEIESLWAGLDYYKAAGVENVVLQCKSMGSYCAIYLFEDIKDTKFFSRGGYLIKHLDREKLLAAVKDIHTTIIKNGITEACVEAELMPWSALGERLIESEFRNYLNLHTDQLNYLKNSDLYTKVANAFLSHDYKAWSENGSDKAHVKRQYTALQKLLVNDVLPDVQIYEQSIDIYKNQLERYGNKSDTYWFCPFNLAYTVRDGIKYLNRYNNYFSEIGGFENLALNLNNLDEAFASAQAFQHKLAGHEGLIIKPLESRLEGVPHALKVRNTDYLQLIYGVNFLRDYQYYLTKRKVDRKMKVSIEEYSLHCKLSEASSSEERKPLFYDILNVELKEKELDTRL